MNEAGTGPVDLLITGAFAAGIGAMAWLLWKSLRHEDPCTVSRETTEGA